MRASDCVVCQILQSKDVTVLDERVFIVTCFSTQELFKKTSRKGRINRIKPKEKTDKDKYCEKEDFLDSLGFLSVEIKILLYVNSQFFFSPKAQIPQPWTCCPYLNILLVNSEPIHLRATVSHFLFTTCSNKIICKSMWKHVRELCRRMNRAQIWQWTCIKKLNSSFWFLDLFWH